MTTDEAQNDRARGDENFLSRWSRRKTEARESAAVPAKPVQVPGDRADAPAASDGTSAAPAAEPLPPVESLHGLEGEYAGFLKPEVDDALRRSALKKLFADPHFNVIDVNEAYSGDWAASAPISATALAVMEQAKRLLVDPDEKAKEANGTEARDQQAGSPSAASDPSDTLAALAGSVDAAQIEPAANPLSDDSRVITNAVPRDEA